MKFTIGFSPEDVDELVQLEKICFPDSQWDQQAFLQLRSRYRWVIVRDKNRIIAYHMSRVQRKRRGQPEFLGLGVHPNYRHRGLGSRLMERDERFYFNQGYRKVILQVRTDNPAQMLYFKRGYRVTKLRHLFYGDVDALEMTKILTKEEYDNSRSPARQQHNHRSRSGHSNHAYRRSARSHA